MAVAVAVAVMEAAEVVGPTIGRVHLTVKEARVATGVEGAAGVVTTGVVVEAVVAGVC